MFIIATPGQQQAFQSKDIQDTSKQDCLGYGMIFQIK